MAKRIRTHIQCHGEKVCVCVCVCVRARAREPINGSPVSRERSSHRWKPTAATRRLNHNHRAMVLPPCQQAEITLAAELVDHWRRRTCRSLLTRCRIIDKLCRQLL